MVKIKLSEKVPKYRKKRKTKCQRCKKMKTEGYFNDVDFGWGNFRKSNWCKVCDRKMDKEREKANNAQRELWHKRMIESGQISKIPLIGHTVMIDFTKNPNGEEREISPGILRTGVGLHY